jgi:hypothetical protein
VEDVIQKALEKDRNLRYQHASEIRADLQRLKRDSDTERHSGAHRARTESSESGGRARKIAEAAQISGSPVVVEVAKQHKLWTVTVAAALFTLIAGSGYGVYSLLHAKRHLPFEKFEITQVTDNGKSVLAAISPDSRYLLFVVNDKGKQSLWLYGRVHQQAGAGRLIARQFVSLAGAGR